MSRHWLYVSFSIISKVMRTDISDDHLSVCWLWLVLLSSMPCVGIKGSRIGGEEGENHHLSVENLLWMY